MTTEPVVRPPSCAEILSAVADAFGLDLGEFVFHRSRTHAIFQARLAAMMLLRTERNMSYPEIGERLCCPYNTVITAVHRSPTLHKPDFVKGLAEARRLAREAAAASDTRSKTGGER